MPITQPPFENYPCDSYKSVLIVLQPPTIPPANGYSVRWRIQGSSNWNDYPVQYGTTFTIVNVPACYTIEVAIKANCDGGSGDEVFTLVRGTNTKCYIYDLVDTAIYTYTPCGTNYPISISITAGMPYNERQVCALDGTVSGGAFTRSVLCTS